MEKHKIRQLAIERLTKLAKSEERQNQVENILENFYQSQIWKTANSIGITMATAFEFPTSPVIQRAFAMGKKVAVPKSLPKGKLAFHWIDPVTPFYTTKFGVDEPNVEALAASDELDLLIVPGLAFSQKGYRIGFGGGYYDRYLANYKGRTSSFVFSEQLMDDWQIEEFDQPVQRLFLSQDRKSCLE